MTDKTNTQVKRLYDSLLKYTDADTALKLAGNPKLSQNPSDINKSEWAITVCNNLDNNFEVDQVKSIRKKCCCKPSSQKIKELRAIYQQSRDLADYADKLNKLNLGASFLSESNVLYMTYPVCYCSFVKKSDQPLPISWCYCTLGYTQKMFEGVFDNRIETELLESIRAGGSRCLIGIKLYEPVTEVEK